MKDEYVEDKLQVQHSNTNINMFAKQQQTQNFHHHHHPPPPQPTFHHPYHLSSTNTRDCEASEEADSPTTPSTATPTNTIVKRQSGGVQGGPSHDGATIEVARRPRGRPPGSKNKPKPPVIITREPEPSMIAYVLELSAGVDIIESVTRFCRKRAIGLCILNGSGAVTNVTLRQPSTNPGATVTFHGRFEILSLSATILPNTAVGSGSASGPLFTISLAGPQGQVFGGPVAGPLASGGPVYLIAATFNSPSFHRLPVEEEARNAAVSGVGGGNEVGHHSPAAVSGGGGGGESGHPPAAVESSSGVGLYSCHLASDVIWAPAARQPPPPPPPY